MWKDINDIWKEAFKLAWESYRKGTIPIGAVIVDSNNNIVSRGRNRIFDESSSNPLAGTYMAHAEMTALTNLKEKEHSNIRTYTLYTTLEPCPMCFGTMVMMNIRNLGYASRDGFAGATELNDKMDYIKNKGINIIREEGELEIFQMALQSAYEYKRQHRRLEEILDTWRVYASSGVALGKKLYEEGYFDDMVMENKDISYIYDEVINRYNLEY